MQSHSRAREGNSSSGSSSNRGKQKKEEKKKREMGKNRKHEIYITCNINKTCMYRIYINCKESLFILLWIHQWFSRMNTMEFKEV